MVLVLVVATGAPVCPPMRLVSVDPPADAGWRDGLS
jgi:hypothetical protein